MENLLVQIKTWNATEVMQKPDNRLSRIARGTFADFAAEYYESLIEEGEEATLDKIKEKLLTIANYELLFDKDDIRDNLEQLGFNPDDSLKQSDLLENLEIIDNEINNRFRFLIENGYFNRVIFRTFDLADDPIKLLKSKLKEWNIEKDYTIFSLIRQTVRNVLSRKFELNEKKMENLQSIIILAILDIDLIEKESLGNYLIKYLKMEGSLEQPSVIGFHGQNRLIKYLKKTDIIKNLLSSFNFDTYEVLFEKLTSNLSVSEISLILDSIGDKSKARQRAIQKMQEILKTDETTPNERKEMLILVKSFLEQ